MSDSWYKVDNVAKVFLATASQRDPRVFRISCTLQEDIDPDTLNTALRATAQEWPQFQVTLHRGLFWHYFESTDLVPTAQPENKAPCAPLYTPERRNKLIYRVTYFGARINLEMFHAITDGNGGLLYLKSIVRNYLALRHPGQLNDVPSPNSASAADLVQDSFRNFYGGTKRDNAAKKVKAYRPRGLRLPYDQLQFFEGHLSAKQVLERCHALGVSMTSYLGASFMLAIYHDMPALERKKPICISLPVNLRNYYPSETARNFFNSVYVTHTLTDADTLETVAPVFDAKLKEVLKPAGREKRHSQVVHPLGGPLCHGGRLQHGPGDGARGTETLHPQLCSVFQLQNAVHGRLLLRRRPCAGYGVGAAQHGHFAAVLPRADQVRAGCHALCHGGGEMNTCPHCHIQVGGDARYCPLCQNRLPGSAGEPYFPATAPRIHRASLLYKIVAFVLSALVVVGGAFDFLLLEETPHRHFSVLMAVWAVALLRVLRAVLRRRFNGPRQIFNLLLLVSALLVFTDWFNGYTGYSLDLVVPILCCVALACNFIFAFLHSNFTANALVYLLMNIGIGVLPYILLFFRIDYDGKLDAHSIPWAICLILSIITFLGLVIFRGRDLKNELVKRLHM